MKAVGATPVLASGLAAGVARGILAVHALGAALGKSEAQLEHSFLCGLSLCASRTHVHGADNCDSLPEDMHTHVEWAAPNWPGYLCIRACGRQVHRARSLQPVVHCGCWTQRHPKRDRAQLRRTPAAPARLWPLAPWCLQVVFPTSTPNPWRNSYDFFCDTVKTEVSRGSSTCSRLRRLYFAL